MKETQWEVMRLCWCVFDCVGVCDRLCASLEAFHFLVIAVHCSVGVRVQTAATVMGGYQSCCMGQIGKWWGQATSDNPIERLSNRS